MTPVFVVNCIVQAVVQHVPEEECWQVTHRRALWTTHATYLFPFWSHRGGLCEVQFCARSQRLATDPCDHFHGSSENNSQSITHHGSEACVTESMSVLTDRATYGILNSELTNCPRTAAVLGESAAQWQQTMESLPRVQQEAVSSRAHNFTRFPFFREVMTPSLMATESDD